MSVTQGNPAVAVMEAALASGVLAPRYQEYVEESIFNNPNSWYSRQVERESRAAADLALERWNRQTCMSYYANGLQSVVRGVLSVARVDTQCKLVKLLDAEQSSRCAFWNSRLPDSRIVVFFNEEAPTRVQDRESAQLWSREGSLQLRAVFLLIGSRGGMAGLSFPQRGLASDDRDGLAMLEFDSSGRTHGRYDSPGSMSARSFLLMRAGLLTAEQAMRVSHGSGHVDSALGYPGALQTVAEALPGLEICLCELAADLQRRGWSSAV